MTKDNSGIWPFLSKAQWGESPRLRGRGWTLDLGAAQGEARLIFGGRIRTLFLRQWRGMRPALRDRHSIR